MYKHNKRPGQLTLEQLGFPGKPNYSRTNQIAIEMEECILLTLLLLQLHQQPPESTQLTD